MISLRRRTEIKLATCEAEELIKGLSRAIELARDSGETQHINDQTRNINYKIIPTLEDKGEVLRRIDND